MPTSPFRLVDAVAAAPISVLVAHGEPLTRAGWRAVLESGDEPGVTVDATAADGDEAVAAAARVQPDVVLMDSALPGLDGIRATHRMRADPAAPEVRVLLIMSSESDDAVLAALRAGASGLLSRHASPDDLVRAVHGVARGEALLAPGIARRLIDHLVARPESMHSRPEHLDELTDREREVMTLVACGLTNHEIAGQLVISPATVKTHVSRAMVKLHAHDRAQLAVLAYQTGLVRAGGPQAVAAAQRIVGRPLDVRLAAA